MKMIDSIEQLLQIQDDKGRIAIPPNVRKLLKVNPDSIIKITYLKLNNEDDTKVKRILPYTEQNRIDKNNRFQTTKTTREYLGLKEKDYIYAKISIIK